MLLHAAAAFFRFRNKKVRANQRKGKMAQQPAKHTPAPALPQHLLVVVDAYVGSAGQPGDVVDAQTSTDFMQSDLQRFVGREGS